MIPDKGQSILTMEERTKVFFERMMIAVIVISGIHFIEDFILDTPAIWVVDLVVVAVAISGYYFHRAGHPITARVLSFILLTSLIFYFAAGTHGRNGIHFHFFSVIAVTVIVFGSRYRRLGLAMVVVAFSLMAFLELNSYHLT